jgi:hypothetical protein
MDRVDYQLHLFTGSDCHTPRQHQFVITTEITHAHIATESVKLSDAVVDFSCENCVDLRSTGRCWEWWTLRPAIDGRCGDELRSDEPCK